MLARNEMRVIPPGRVERWLGFEKAEHLRRSMRGWYGRPINLIDVPGSVWVTKDGDFIGKFNRGYFGSALDALEDYLKLSWRELGRPNHAMAAAGFASISDALNRASDGFSQRRPFVKIGSAGAAGISNSLWRSGSQPASGAAPGNAPGGTAYTNASVGAVNFANPSVGSNRLVGADVSSNVINHTLLAYDLIFGCNKTMNSIAAEAVTGVPTRYQSSTATAEDYAGDNFLFVQVGGTALPATAHNWASCTYTDQDGNLGAVLPTITGVSSAIVDRYDHSLSEWFAPLASGDNGIRNLTNMQCSALVATGVIWFMMGHPLGFMSFPVASSILPFDWLTNRDQAPRVFNGACVAFLEPLKPGAGAVTYTGRIYTTSTSS